MIDSTHHPVVVAIHPAYATALAGRQAGEPEPAQPRSGGIAVVSMRGAITKYGDGWGMGSCCSTLGIAGAVRAAADDPEIASILLLVDSPGGEVPGIEQAVEAVRYAKARKPVEAYVDDMAASAAYWVASQADRISANAAGMVGSIGAYAVVADTTGMLDKAGIKLHVVASSPKKGEHAAGAVTDEQLAEVQRHVDATAKRFVADVAAGRGKAPEDVEAYADGSMYPAEDALAVGLIDAVETLGSAVERLADQARRGRVARARYAARVEKAKLIASHMLAGLDNRPRPGRQLDSRCEAAHQSEDNR